MKKSEEICQEYLGDATITCREYEHGWIFSTSSEQKIYFVFHLESDCEKYRN